MRSRVVPKRMSVTACARRDVVVGPSTPCVTSAFPSNEPMGMAYDRLLAHLAVNRLLGLFQETALEAGGQMVRNSRSRTMFLTLTAACSMPCATIAAVREARAGARQIVGAEWNANGFSAPRCRLACRREIDTRLSARETQARRCSSATAMPAVQPGHHPPRADGWTCVVSWKSRLR
jgi:hypothetical protein